MKTNSEKQRGQPPVCKIIDDYTIAKCWETYLDNRLPIFKAEATEEEIAIFKHLFYVGFGECVDLLTIVGNSNVSDDEASEFLARIENEIMQQNLRRTAYFAGKQ